MTAIPKIIDNYKTTIVGNYGTTATAISVATAPLVITEGYLTIFDFDGNQLEKMKFTNVDGNVLTCVRGLSFTVASDTPVVGNAKEIQNGMTVKLSVSLNYFNPMIDFMNQYDGKWMGAVADYAALVALPSPQDGEVRVTLDDSKIYVYDLDTTTWNLAGAGGGAGTVYITTKLGTEAEGDDNKTFQLTSGSFPAEKYLQVYKNGVLQELGATADYTTNFTAGSGNQAIFNTAVEDADKITLLVVSVDIYNPSWNNVTGSLIPDTTNTYDIGSDTKRFKDGYFEGNVDIDGTLNVEGVATFQDTIIPSGGITGYEKAIVSFTAGENITGATTPQPVYYKKSDGRVYLADANGYVLYDKEFLGFAITTATTGNAVSIQLSGIVPGFTGLTDGSIYYVSDSVGTIGTTIGTIEIQAGYAIGTTSILIKKRDYTYTVGASSNTRVGNGTQITITETTYTKKKEIRYQDKPGTIRVQTGAYCNTSVIYVRVYVNGVAAGAEHTSNSSSLVQWTDDIAVQTGDLVQFYSYVGSAGGTQYIQTFNLQYDKTQSYNAGVVTLP